MSAAVAKEPKAKKGLAADDRSNRKTAPVQVEKDLARMCAVIASHDGITQSELISAHLRPFLLMHYERVQKAIRAELDARLDL